MKTAQIIGARPQFIKYSAVNMAIGRHNRRCREPIEDILINTGQHYDYKMSELFFEELGLKEPDYNLGVGSGTHAYQTGKIIEEAETILTKEKPDVVIVYGDTNTTLGGALAASKLQLPVIHVEAGLRSFNKHMQEEINRILTDHLSEVLFCPSASAVGVLKEEGFENIVDDGKLISRDKVEFDFSVGSSTSLVLNVGDVMFDVLNYFLEIAESDSTIMDENGLAYEDCCLLTIHRAESTESTEKFRSMMEFVNDMASDKCIVFPVHPRTRKLIDETNIKLADNVKQIDPLGYFDMLMLIKSSNFIMTDSGGVQKEAYWLKTPCITLRDETEWSETLESGWNVLYKDYQGNHIPSESNHFYGDGKAAERIVQFLTSIEWQNGVIRVESEDIEARVTAAANYLAGQ